MVRRVTSWILLISALVAPAAWACKPPDDIQGFEVRAIASTSVRLAFAPPAKGKVLVKIQASPLSWDRARDVICDASPCVVTALTPGRKYDVQAIPFYITHMQVPIYGARTRLVTFKTLRKPAGKASR